MSKSMSHWYPRYPADYGKKTRHLSLVEHGAYALMMDYCYSTGNPIPANAEQLHRICMAFAPSEQEACRRVLHEFFEERSDGWYNSRVDEELQKRNEISGKRADAARKRHANAPAKGDANAPANAPANAYTSTSTSTYKEERPKGLLSPETTEPDQERLAFDAYNVSAKRVGWPLAQTLNKARRSSLKARLAECGGPDGWLIALGKAEASPHLCGQNDRGWRADLDFLLQQKSFVKLMEGSYDPRQRNHQQNPGHRPGQQNGADPALANIARIVGLNRA